MAKVNGTVMSVLSGADSILWSTSATLNIEQDLPDSTTKDSAGWEEHINGVRRWSIDFEGAYDVSGSGLTANEIIAAIVARSADTVIKFATAAGATTGWTGNGTFKNVTLTAPMEDKATFSGSIVGNGALAAI